MTVINYLYFYFTEYSMKYNCQKQWFLCQKMADLRLIWSCYANISAVEDLEKNQFFKKWMTMIGNLHSTTKFSGNVQVITILGDTLTQSIESAENTSNCPSFTPRNIWESSSICMLIVQIFTRTSKVRWLSKLNNVK